MLRIGTTMALPAVLRSLGVNPAEMLAEAGFDIGLFDDPDNLISYTARGRLMAHCVARTGCQHLGLLVGQQNALHSLGLVGSLVKYSPDVGTALRNLVRYLHLRIRGAVPTLTAGGSAAIFGYHQYQSGSPAADQVADGAVAFMFNILRDLCGSGWKPAEVWFAHREPENVEPFREFFHVLPRFDAEQNALVFSSSWLRRPLSAADANLQRLLQKQMNALEVRHSDDFPEQVRSVLRASLVTRNAGADDIAALFSMHARTLHRRLNACGTGFRQILDEIRFEIARETLENSALAIDETAALLDYADARSFIRAFRRWSGTTPAKWRASRNNRKRNFVAIRR